MLEALDARAVLDEKDRTQIVRDALAQYLDLPEDSVEDKLVMLEKKQTLFDKQLQRETQRTDALEIRMKELNRLISAFLERI